MAEKEILLKRVYDVDTNKLLREEWLDEYIPPNGGTPPAQGELIYITPSFELGASTEGPSLGNGWIVAWYTVEEYTNGTKVELELYIHVDGGSKGVGTGSYEVYLPDDIEPAEDYYVGHANAWISGGGISEFDGSVKWTHRNEVKGPKLIFTFDGQEWSPTSPKDFGNLKLRANISYWL